MSLWKCVDNITIILYYCYYEKSNKRYIELILYGYTVHKSDLSLVYTTISLQYDRNTTTTD